MSQLPLESTLLALLKLALSDIPLTSAPIDDTIDTYMVASGKILLREDPSLPHHFVTSGH